jgi:perosamine synthetase
MKMISRFCFNISIQENIKNILSILFFKKNNFEADLKKEMSKIYNDSNFYFFDYGRTAFFEILSDIKKKTKKRKILINSLTLFEIINVIIYSGFVPVFIDNKKNTFQTDIDLNNFKSDLGQIAGIVVTHLNGINQNVIELKKQIESHNSGAEKIFLIEDCAVAMGAHIDGKIVGTFGDFSFLSFNIMKNITTYTGGVLLDNQKTIKFDNFKYRKSSKIYILKKAIFVFFIQLLNTKLIFPLFFKFIKFSYKYSFNFFLKKYRTDFEVKIENKFPTQFCFLMHSFQKKILLDQLKGFKIKQINRIKKSNFYFDNLNKIQNLNFPQSEFNEKNIFLEFPIICDAKKTKNELFEYLLDKKIDVKNYYYKNCSEQQIYSSYSPICLNSKSISENIIMLPVHEKITKDYQQKVVDVIKNFYNK